MFRFLPAILKKQALRDLGLVSAGQLAAQIITFAAMPVITRLYAPDAIGMQGLFLSLVGLLLTFCSLSLPIAIVLPKEDREARSLLRLSIYVSLAAFVLLEILLLSAGEPLARWLDAEGLLQYGHLVCLSVLLGSVTAALSQYFVRERLYRQQAQITVSNAVILNASRLTLGVVQPGAGNLILANVFATAVNYLQYAVRWRMRFGRLFERESPHALWALLGKYRDFPLLRTPQVAINAFSQFLPLWLLALYMGSSAAGQYAVAISLLGAPAALLGKAIGDVFYPRLTALHHAGETTRPLIVKATLASLGVVIVPFTIVVIFGPQIFRFIYGADWSQAGEYARWLAYWSMLQAVNRPAVVATSVLNIQGGLLIYELFSTGAKLAALWLGFALYGDDMVAVALFSVAGIAAYVCLILWVVLRSGKEVRLRGE